MGRLQIPALVTTFLICCAAIWSAEEGVLSVCINVRFSDLSVSPIGANWPSYNGDYTGRRYSRLNQITRANVRQLRAQWVFHAPNSNHLEGTPVVINGMLFMTSGNDAFAIDARNGRTVWHYSRPVTEGLVDDASAHHNRGVGVFGSRVYLRPTMRTYSVSMLAPDN